MRPSRTASSAGPASFAASTYHWSVRNGSIATLERSPCGTVWVSSSMPSSQPWSLGEGDDQLARLVAVEAVEVGELVGRACALPEGGVVLERDPGAGVHDVDRGEAGALADLPVVEVVGRGDLDRAGALLGVGVGVGDDRDAPPDQRQADGLADEVGVARIVGVDGDAGVAEHGLGAGGGDDEVVAGLEGGGAAVVVEGGRVLVGGAVLERVAQAPEVALRLDLLDLEVGDRGLEVRVPVDQALAAEDQAALVEVDEDLQHRVVEVALLAGGRARGAGHGEGVARQVEGVAEARATARGWCRPTAPSTPRPWRRRRRGPSRGGSGCPRGPARARRPSAWRCRRGRGRAARARRSRASGASGRARPSACG